MYQMKTPENLTSYKGITCTVSVNNVLGVNLQYRECLDLVT